MCSKNEHIVFFCGKINLQKMKPQKHCNTHQLKLPVDIERMIEKLRKTDIRFMWLLNFTSRSTRPIHTDAPCAS